jgi:hypothetical protein
MTILPGKKISETTGLINVSSQFMQIFREKKKFSYTLSPTQNQEKELSIDSIMGYNSKFIYFQFKRCNEARDSTFRARNIPNEWKFIIDLTQLKKLNTKSTKIILEDAETGARYNRGDLEYPNLENTFYALPPYLTNKEIYNDLKDVDWEKIFMNCFFISAKEIFNVLYHSTPGIRRSQKKCTLKIISKAPRDKNLLVSGVRYRKTSTKYSVEYSRKKIYCIDDDTINYISDSTGEKLKLINYRTFPSPISRSKKIYSGFELINEIYNCNVCIGLNQLLRDDFPDVNTFNIKFKIPKLPKYSTFNLFEINNGLV